MNAFLFFFILFILSVIFIKYLFKINLHSPFENSHTPSPGHVSDEIVKDPYCNVYVPKNLAIKFCSKEKVLFFCSIKCKNKYLKKNNMIEQYRSK